MNLSPASCPFWSFISFRPFRSHKTTARGKYFFSFSVYAQSSAFLFLQTLFNYRFARLIWYSELRQGNGQKSKPLCAGLAVTATRVTACCWMALKCSAEPKRRYVAQIAVFSAEAEPIWRRNKISPQGARMRFSVSDSRFSLCPAGCVSRYSKQGLCVPQKSQSQPKSAASLGAQPPIPRKERCVWGKMFVLPSV